MHRIFSSIFCHKAPNSDLGGAIRNNSFNFWNAHSPLPPDAFNFEQRVSADGGFSSEQPTNQPLLASSYRVDTFAIPPSLAAYVRRLASGASRLDRFSVAQRSGLWLEPHPKKSSCSRAQSEISGTPVCRCLVGLKNLSLINSIKRKAALKRCSRAAAPAGKRDAFSISMTVTHGSTLRHARPPQSQLEEAYCG